MKNKYALLIAACSILSCEFNCFSAEATTDLEKQQEQTEPTIESTIAALPEIIMTYDKDQKITKKDIQKELVAIITTMQGSDFSLEHIPEFAKQMATNLAIIKIVAQKGRDLGLQPDMNAVQAQIDELKQTPEGIKQLEVYGTEEQAKTLFSEYSMLDVYIDHEIIAKIKIPDHTIKAFYDKYQKEKFLAEPIGKRVSHILISDPDLTKGKAKIDEIFVQLKNGKSFAELAQKESDCESKAQGGNIGIIADNQSNVDPDFLAVVKKTKLGEISDPFKSQFGYHILKIDGINEKEVVVPFEQAKIKIEEELKYNATEEVVNKMYNQIIQDYHFKFNF